MHVAQRFGDATNTQRIAHLEPTTLYLLAAPKTPDGVRGRGGDRTEANPLQIVILTCVPLPIRVDEVLTWSEIQPPHVQVMWARGAVPVSYKDMAVCYPDLFESAEAARKALKRQNPGQTPIEYH